ncbi:30S ribosomal protein S6 [Entomospira culicis]|uniref:Small ribosomal subunit protein bS6 n=1 Tax=Entomospira culicis TaxID=2719989 RepID=A0A968KVZ2_9SPIO|nr:30S ribosomal protein S6 [Entomospira culicis]NIZ19427.1 30S ribosomal protein S6 [Entomospira culicis]NIZ69668.1 30S ribosomal protein S6 [Entomospira culicis]WDI36778.1 30S ribosomal protein S6 [Entomospira culicis]WDI38407.1 30S ribosomal protein S6 [Entomospira culicis]
MNNYELVCIFNVKENFHTEGVDAIRTILKNQGATIVKEEDMGARNLAYEINKENRGHYHLYLFEREGEMTKIDELLKLQKGLIRHLFIKLEKPRKQRIRVRKPLHTNQSNPVESPTPKAEEE